MKTPVLARTLLASITFLLLASGATMFAQTIRYSSEHRATADSREQVALLLPQAGNANDSSSMIASVIHCLKAVFEPEALKTRPDVAPKQKHRGAWDSSIVPAFDRSGWPALQPLSVSSQVSTNTTGGLPPTYDEFLKQNAAQEKSSEAGQTLLVLGIVLLVAMALAGRWVLRR